MISVDNRAGSEKLFPLLKGLGVEVELTRLSFGDVAWLGHGQDGLPVNVGVECKSLDDILACIIGGRYAGHQLPGMLKCYDHLYLLIEGEWRCRAADGVLEQRKQGRGGGWYWAESGGGQRQWMWRDVESWLMSIAILASVRIVKANTYEDVARWLKVAYGWYQKEDHKSVGVLYGGKKLFVDKALLIKPSLVRMVAKELPGIRDIRSEAVAARFSSVESMVNASEQEWASIDGIGRGIAKTVYKAIHNSNNGNGNGGKHR